MFQPFTVLYSFTVVCCRPDPQGFHLCNFCLTTSSLCSSVPYIHRFPSFQRDLVELLDRHGGQKPVQNLLDRRYRRRAHPSLCFIQVSRPAATSKAGRVRVSFLYPSRNPLSTVSPTQSLSLGGHLSLLPPSHVPTVSCF